MNTTTRFSDTEIDQRNKLLARKILVSWLICFATLFIVQAMETKIRSVPLFVGQYLPVIGKIQSMKSEIGQTAASYVAVLSLMVPFITLYLVWGESISARFRVGEIGLKNQGRGLLERFFVMYMLGVPFILGILFLMGAAPFDFVEIPRLFGQYVVHWMLTTMTGLAVFGSLAGVAAALLLATLIFYILLPINLLYTFFQGDAK